MYKGDEDRRAEVAEMLTDCTDAKLLRGGTARALELGRQAYEQATATPILPSPWPQLAAYRLAHLKLRCAPEEADLHEVDRLLCEASVETPANLGPMPKLFRLAVLHRLSRSEDAATGGCASTILESAFKNACTEVRRWLARQAMEPDSGHFEPHRGLLQDGLFNMLELAAYFLGEKYEGLEGVGGPFRDLKLGPDSWKLVGPDPKIATICMPRELAFAELEDRGRLRRGSVLFRLFPDRAEWKLAEQSDWGTTSEDKIHILALLLAHRDLQTKALQSRVTRDDGGDPAARFRKIKQRLNEEFKELSGKDFELVPQPDRRSLVTHIDSRATVFGAVEKSWLRR